MWAKLAQGSRSSLRAAAAWSGGFWTLFRLSTTPSRTHSASRCCAGNDRRTIEDAGESRGAAAAAPGALFYPHRLAGDPPPALPDPRGDRQAVPRLRHDPGYVARV